MGPKKNFPSSAGARALVIFIQKYEGWMSARSHASYLHEAIDSRQSESRAESRYALRPWANVLRDPIFIDSPLETGTDRSLTLF